MIYFFNFLQTNETFVVSEDKNIYLKCDEKHQFLVKCDQKMTEKCPRRVPKLTQNLKPLENTAASKFQKSSAQITFILALLLCQE